MPGYYKNKYRNDSFRLQTWNYASQAMYFITICCKWRKFYFGDVIDGRVHLSELGNIAEKEWLRTPDLRPDMNLRLGAFIIMPDHMHGIIGIGKNQYNESFESKESLYKDSRMEKVPLNSFGPQRKNLASIIRGYKSSVTMYARKNDLEFEWQSLYHDHIIRTKEAYNRISNYILNNPANF